MMKHTTFIFNRFLTSFRVVRNDAALILLLVLFSGKTLSAQTNQDTISTEHITLHEVEILSQKEAERIQDIPASVSTFSQEQIETANMISIKDISAAAANIYIPDYGTKLTSAIYIRGVGSRIGAPSVGFYVDNMPQNNQYAFDFALFDIQNIEILRGPQGTLYGRNSLGGIIHIHTLSPMQYQGTNVKLFIGNGALFQNRISHYQKINDKIAFSLGCNIASLGGFLKNQHNGDFVDKEYASSVRARVEWYINPHLKLQYIINYEHSRQYGYPYGAFNKQTHTIAPVNYNDPATYRRNLLNNNLQLEYQARHFKITSTTTYQYLTDTMVLDQDFTPASKFTLSQAQKLQNISQEVLLRSTTTSNIQWIAGAFAFYEHLNTNAPVTLKKEFITHIDSVMNANPNMPFPVHIENEKINVEGNYTSPTCGAAVFAQGTVNHLIIKNLSLTAGLRLNYEKAALESHTFTNKIYCNDEKDGKMIRTCTLTSNDKIDFMPLLPKISIQYYFTPKNMMYASVARGYKAGGYNIQMFSDLLQSKLQGKPENAAMGSEGDTLIVKETYHIDINNIVAFKPEYSWNYEIGIHSELIEKRLSGDLSLFYININNQQIAEFSPQGTGRMIKNAGQSRSYGTETSLRSTITKNLNCNLLYGFTMANFTNYTVRRDTIHTDDFSGNRVPFSPQHTLSISADYKWELNKEYIDNIQFNLQCIGNGNIYWTEDNEIHQPFYALLNANISLRKNRFQLDIWGKNLCNTTYPVFYFETMGNPFAQKGNPLQWGMTLSAKF